MVRKKVSYSEALDEIKLILSRIENEELDVDELTENVQRVSSLLRSCREKLHQTEMEVEKILKEMEG
jgi:exodeoxyribonuclease VII small subunit